MGLVFATCALPSLLVFFFILFFFLHYKLGVFCFFLLQITDVNLCFFISVSVSFIFDSFFTVSIYIFVVCLLVKVLTEIIEHL